MLAVVIGFMLLTIVRTYQQEKGQIVFSKGKNKKK
jgi:hypothetical protein